MLVSEDYPEVHLKESIYSDMIDYCCHRHGVGVRVKVPVTQTNMISVLKVKETGSISVNGSDRQRNL